MLFLTDDMVEYILNAADLLIRYKYPYDSTVSDVKVSPCERYAACMVEDSTKMDTYNTHVIRLGDTIGEYIDVISGTVRFGESEWIRSWS